MKTSLLFPCSLLVLLSFLAGCRTTPDADKSFVFASWNIGHYALGNADCSFIYEKDAAAQSKAYRAFLDEVGADVLGVAEYSARFTRDGETQADAAVFGRYAHKVIGPQHSYHWNAHFWNGCEFVSTRTVDYPKRKAPVYYVVTRLKVCGEEIVFVNTHLDWQTYAEGHLDDRKLQMRKLVDDFKGEKRVVIAGDFNEGIRFADKTKKTIDNPIEYKVFADAGFTLGNDGRYKTYPSEGKTDLANGYALDNIIVKGVVLEDFRVLYRPDLSDHALVRARLTVK